MTVYYFDGYPVDCMLNAGHNAESDVTDFETEADDFQDHIRNKAIELTFTVIVSNSPLADIAAVRKGVDNSGQDVAAFTDEAFATFDAIREARQPITIEAPLKVYRLMAMTSFSVPQEVDDGDSLRFEISFKQIRRVQSKRTTVTVTLPRAKGPKRKGVVGNETGKYVLAHNPTTGKDAYYFPDTGKYYDEHLDPIKDPSGYQPMKFDDTSKRWVDKSGKPFQDIPPSSAPTDTRTNDQRARQTGKGYNQGQYDPFWDVYSSDFLNGSGPG